MTQTARIRQLIGAAEIARRYGVAVRTVAVWRQRGRERGRPFPDPDTVISTSGDFLIPGWREDQLPDIDEWVTGLSNSHRWGVNR